MGDFLTALPQIARFIGAVYDEKELIRAYDDFMNTPEPEELPGEDHDGYGIWWTNWVLQGRTLRFVICIEKGEMLYGWAVRCPDEETYYSVKAFMAEIL